MILSCYPDFGKAPPEYIVNLIDLLSTYPERFLVKMVDLRTGIVSRCAYLPTIAEVVSMAKELENVEQLIDDERQRKELARIGEAERKSFWTSRESLLKKAQEKYPGAFLNTEGKLMYFADREKSLPTEEEIALAKKTAARTAAREAWETEQRAIKT